MNEYMCHKKPEKILNRKYKMMDSQRCSFQYAKNLHVNSTFNRSKQNKDIYLFCSNPFFCEHKSLFIFEEKKHLCKCGKQLPKDQTVCLECELTENAEKKASEIINLEWAV